MIRNDLHRNATQALKSLRKKSVPQHTARALRRTATFRKKIETSSIFPQCGKQRRPITEAVVNDQSQTLIRKSADMASDSWRNILFKSTGFCTMLQLKDFKNSATKDNAWKEVADELGAKGNIQFSRTLSYCWYSFQSFYEEKLLASSQQSCCIFYA